MDDEKIEKEFFKAISNDEVVIIQSMLEKEDKEPLPIWKFRNFSRFSNNVLHESLLIDSSSEIITLLLNYLESNYLDYVKLINTPNSQEVYPIHFAAFKGNISLIKRLIELGAKVDVLTSRKLTVLHYAAQGDQPGVIYYFHKKYKMNIDQTDQMEATPLHWACNLGGEAAVTYLLAYGANVNYQNKTGFTPLHIATLKDNTKIVRKLLQNGADLNIKDYKGKKPKDIAEEKEFFKTSTLLKRGEKCQLCNVKAPVKPIRNKRLNIYILIGIQIGLFFFLFFEVFPILCSCEGKETIALILAIIYLLMLIVFFVIFIFLISTDAGKFHRDEKVNLDALIETEERIDFRNICPVCNIYLKQTTKHCSLCNKCIKHYDHHCYWVNNCIGESNFQLFFSFIIYGVLFEIFILSITSFIYYKLLIKNQIGKWENYVFHSVIGDNFTVHIIVYPFIFLCFFVILIPTIFLLIFHSRKCFKKNSKKKKTLGAMSTISLLTINQDDISL